MKYLLFLIAFLIAAPALATNDIWVTFPGATSADACSLINNEVCYLDTAADGATPIIPSKGCRFITATIVSDISDNSLTTNTAQVFRFMGKGSTVLSDDDEAISVSTIVLNGTNSYYGFDAPSVYFRVDWTTGTARAILQCFQ